MITEYGKLIKQLRVSNNMNQAEFASIIEKTPMYISNIESGKNGPLRDSDLERIFLQLNPSRDIRSQIQIAAIKENNKLPEAMVRYICEKPGTYELICRLCEKGADSNTIKRLLEYYERL